MGQHFVHSPQHCVERAAPSTSPSCNRDTSLLQDIMKLHFLHRTHSDRCPFHTGLLKFLEDQSTGQLTIKSHQDTVPMHLKKKKTTLTNPKHTHASLHNQWMVIPCYTVIPLPNKKRQGVMSSNPHNGNKNSEMPSFGSVLLTSSCLQRIKSPGRSGWHWFAWSNWSRENIEIIVGIHKKHQKSLWNVWTTPKMHQIHRLSTAPNARAFWFGASTCIEGGAIVENSNVQISHLSSPVKCLWSRIVWV